MEHAITVCRNAAEQEAKEQKNSMLVLERLKDFYRQLDPADKALADQVLCTWLQADEGYRFDALALIREFKIATALPHLRSLAAGLTRSKQPGAPFELQKVETIMQTLIAATNSRGQSDHAS